MARAGRAGRHAACASSGSTCMYDLADALERAGERGPCPRVFADLEFDAASYRDVPERLATLRRALGEGPAVMALLLAAFFLEVGFVLLVVPWSSYWDRNYFSQVWPPLHALLTSNYVRGAVSGLGVVNVHGRASARFAELFRAGRARASSPRARRCPSPSRADPAP